MRDVFDEHGVYKYQEISDKVPNKANIILRLNSIWLAIPKEWKTLLKDEEENQIQFDLHVEENIGLPITVTIKEIKKCFTKKTEPTKHEIKWELIFGDLNWGTIYKGLWDCLCERKVIEFQWKIIHNGITSETRLKQMNKSDGICKLCQLEEESIRHLLFDCELVQLTWRTIIGWLKTINNSFKLKETMVLFGLIESEELVEHRSLIQYVIFTTNWIIWKRRNKMRYDHIWIDENTMIRQLKGELNDNIAILLHTNRMFKMPLEKNNLENFIDTMNTQ